MQCNFLGRDKQTLPKDHEDLLNLTFLLSGGCPVNTKWTGIATEPHQDKK